MNYVFVVDTNKTPLQPVHAGWARKLLATGRAAVLRTHPFTIILKTSVDGTTSPEIAESSLRLKIDPGSKVTGLAITDRENKVLFAAEIEHRGTWVKKKLDQRRGVRRSRRNRKTRYRPSRINNRARPSGWLPPSLESRIGNVMTWVERLSRLAPLRAISMELVKFDTQLLDNPNICSVEYQQGDLFGYELKEYLLEKYQRTCVYCGNKDVPLEIEHIIPKSRGGSNRASNLAIACVPCNQRKGSQTAAEFGFPEVQAQAKKPLKDAAAVNTTRWALWKRLNQTGLLSETGTGGRTKWNRTNQRYPKAHWIDAACVGESGSVVTLNPEAQFLHIKACGHGSRRMCTIDKYGFPRSKAKARAKKIHGFQTGDTVELKKDTGKHQGVYQGKVAIRASGSFDLKRQGMTAIGASWKKFRLIQHTDGYQYVVANQQREEKCS